MITIEPILLDVDVSVEEYELEYTEEAALDVELATAIIVEKITGDDYEGEYTITPSAETQVLQTKDFVMNDNLTINPIPNNYGLITWNGSVITVS